MKPKQSNHRTEEGLLPRKFIYFIFFFTLFHSLHCFLKNYNIISFQQQSGEENIESVVAETIV